MSEVNNNTPKPLVENYTSRYAKPDADKPQAQKADQVQEKPDQPEVSETAQLTAQLLAKHATSRPSGKVEEENS